MTAGIGGSRTAQTGTTSSGGGVPAGSGGRPGRWRRVFTNRGGVVRVGGSALRPDRGRRSLAVGSSIVEATSLASVLASSPRSLVDTSPPSSSPVTDDASGSAVSPEAPSVEASASPAADSPASSKSDGASSSLRATGSVTSKAGAVDCSLVRSASGASTSTGGGIAGVPLAVSRSAALGAWPAVPVTSSSVRSGLATAPAALAAPSGAPARFSTSI